MRTMDGNTIWRNWTLRNVEFRQIEQTTYFVVFGPGIGIRCSLVDLGTSGLFRVQGDLQFW